jgi:hypothetical protein
MKPPPSNHTITGAPPAGISAGAQTFRVRQSSLVPGASERRSGFVSTTCTGSGPKAEPSCTPVHGSRGCGGRQRSGPTGGAANGMPR